MQEGKTPLQRADDAGHEKVAKLLADMTLTGAELNAMLKLLKDQGLLDLLSASRSGSTTMVKELLACGVDANAMDEVCSPQHALSVLSPAAQHVTTWIWCAVWFVCWRLL